MAPTQVSAGLGLLKKALPDLAAIQHSGDEDNPLFPTDVNVNLIRPEKRSDPTDD